MRRLFAGAFLLAAVVSSVQADDPPQFILKWGSLGSGEGNPPRGIAIALNGTVYVVDTNNNRIQHFDSHGTFLDIWGTGGTAPGEFGVPRGP